MTIALWCILVAALIPYAFTVAAKTARYVSLLQVDTLWTQHMKRLNYVKDFAGLKAYAQEDPLEVYRTEGDKLFDSMQKAYQQNTAFSFAQYNPKQQAAPADEA